MEVLAKGQATIRRGLETQWQPQGRHWPQLESQHRPGFRATMVNFAE